MAYDTLYDNIGILAVPPQIGSTVNVIQLVTRIFSPAEAWPAEVAVVSPF